MAQIFVAAQEGDLEKVRSLMEQGIDMEANPFDYGRFPLHVACENGHLEVVMYLVEKNANKDVTDFLDKTPLHHAAAYGRLEVVQYLVQQGANKEVTGDYRVCSALYVAAFNGHLEIVRIW